MTTPAPTEAELAMARKILASCEGDPTHARHALQGLRDDTRSMKLIVAAIRATTESAAALVDQCNREGPYNAIGAAALIRANRHLRGEQS